MHSEGRLDLMTSTVDISRAIKIDGWMETAELTWLAEQAAQHDVIVEIGSFLGRSTRALGDNARGTVIAIDTWIGPVADDRTLYPSFYQQFDDNLKDLIQSGKVIPVDIMLTQINVYECDFCFIDADHKYESVRNDIRYWMQKIRVGGIISGHDIDYPDVRRAVVEIFPDALIVPGTRIWYKIL